MRFMKRVLIFCFAELVSFEIFACVFQCIRGEELSPTLTEWHYKVFGIELGALALLKIAEITITKLKAKKADGEPPAEEEGE